MALTKFQEQVLAVLSKTRNPNSHFAGGATLNRNGPRLSNDFDIFNDDPAILAASVTTDLSTLAAHGFPANKAFDRDARSHHFKCTVSRDGQSTEIDWSCDSVHRFFPAIRDSRFGWRLTEIDLATNKILALAGRREPRDYVDIVELHSRGVTIATLAIAAPAKDPGFTPELILDEITRNSRFTENDLKAVNSLQPIDPVATKKLFLEGIAEARDILSQISFDQVGMVCVHPDGRPITTTLAALQSDNVIKRPASAYGALPQLNQIFSARNRGDDDSGSGR